jgi:hypothetical protein
MWFLLYDKNFHLSRDSDAEKKMNFAESSKASDSVQVLDPMFLILSIS